MASGLQDSHRVAIVGASSLRGKELRQVLEDRHFPAKDIVLLDESALAGTLTESAGEPTFLRALQKDSFEGARFVFFAGSARDAEQNWRVAQSAGATVIDLTGALATPDSAAGLDVEPATVWIPALHSVLPAARLKTNGSRAARAYSSPAAAVILATTLAAGLAGFHPHRVSVVLFPPVSERGEAGVEELESQTTKLLSFQPIAQTVFDAQIAFNLLAAYGPESKLSLADMRGAVAREVAGYLGDRVPVPAIQLVQAPVFYGYAFSAYVEFSSPVPSEQLEAAFANLGVRISATGDAAPTNASVAGDSEIQLARIEADPNVANGVWMWGIADNLRLAATNAVRIAEGLVAKSDE